jgi:hypothetical protein
MSRAELVERLECALENAPKAKRATAALAAIEASWVLMPIQPDTLTKKKLLELGVGWRDYSDLLAASPLTQETNDAE